jgi:hypothetical protein
LIRVGCPLCPTSLIVFGHIFGGAIIFSGYVITEIHDKLLVIAGNNYKRNTSKFITAQECANIMIDAGINKDRECIIGAVKYFRPISHFLPYFITDAIIKHTALSAFERND